MASIKQLGVLFSCYWIFWFLESVLWEQVFNQETHSLAYLFFRATWMAFFMTIAFGWKTIKALFRHHKN